MSTEAPNNPAEIPQGAPPLIALLVCRDAALVSNGTEWNFIGVLNTLESVGYPMMIRELRVYCAIRDHPHPVDLELKMTNAKRDVELWTRTVQYGGTRTARGVESRCWLMQNVLVPKHGSWFVGAYYRGYCLGEWAVVAVLIEPPKAPEAAPRGAMT